MKTSPTISLSTETGLPPDLWQTEHQLPKISCSVVVSTEQEHNVIRHKSIYVSAGNMVTTFVDIQVLNMDLVFRLFSFLQINNKKTGFFQFLVYIPISIDYNKKSSRQKLIVQNEISHKGIREKNVRNGSHLK